jgi:Mlc titration factor MtfA (ptsG expression regulator)
MNPWLFLALVGAAIALALWMPRWRLRRALAAPFPPAWDKILERNIGSYRDLPPPLRERLRLLIKQFLHKKHFSGAAGLQITDEVRVTIAAEACLLILNRPTGVYPALRYIIVYPTAFIVRRGQTDDDGIVNLSSRGVLGESWHKGKVILAWDSVLRGARNFVDGENVVLHEFAHQLDSQDGAADGAPLLGSEHSYRSWAALLDHYGATNPAEFFAVATETFFERPAQMAEHHAELFETLQAYYRLDPRDWSPVERSGDRG